MGLLSSPGLLMEYGDERDSISSLSEQAQELEGQLDGLIESLTEAADRLRTAVL